MRKFNRRTKGALKRCWDHGKRGREARSYLLAHSVPLPQNQQHRFRSKEELERRMKIGTLRADIERQERRVASFAAEYNYYAVGTARRVLYRLQDELHALLAQP